VRSARPVGLSNDTAKLLFVISIGIVLSILFSHTREIIYFKTVFIRGLFQKELFFLESVILRMPKIQS
jgi:hypothetical protein